MRYGDKDEKAIRLDGDKAISFYSITSTRVLVRGNFKGYTHGFGSVHCRGNSDGASEKEGEGEGRRGEGEGVRAG